jgi:outer membrane protein assembly factor BamB
VAAFDGSSAAATRRWTGLVPGVAGPYVAAGGGVVVVNANTTGGAALFAFDAAGVRNCTRAVPNVCLPVWQTDAVSIGFERPPAIADGVVYRVIGNQLRAYDASGSTGCAGTPRVCQRLWIADAGPGATAPAVANGLVYTSANDGFVEAFDAEGATNCSATTRVCSAIWSADVNVNLGTVEVADGRLFVAAGDGSVRVFGLPAP